MPSFPRFTLPDSAMPDRIAKKSKLLSIFNRKLIDSEPFVSPHYPWESLPVRVDRVTQSDRDEIGLSDKDRFFIGPVCYNCETEEDVDDWHVSCQPVFCERIVIVSAPIENLSPEYLFNRLRVTWFAHLRSKARNREAWFCIAYDHSDFKGKDRRVQVQFVS